jgi:hypothetical protein
LLGAKNVQEELGEQIIKIRKIGDSLELDTQVQVPNRIKDVLPIQNVPTIDFFFIPGDFNYPVGVLGISISSLLPQMKKRNNNNNKFFFIQ